MKKKFIKVLCCILASLMVLSSSPFFAFAKVSAPPAPKAPTATSTTTTVTLKWSKVSKAKGYTLYRYDSKTKKSYTVASTTKLTYKVTKLKAGTTYCYYTKAYALNGKKKVYSKASPKLTVATLPVAPTPKASAKTYSSLYVSYNKVTGASGYKLQYSTDKSFKSGVKTVEQTALNKTITGLKENTTYYARVYAFRKVGTKKYYSAASKIVQAKTPEKPIQIDSVSTLDTKTTYQTIDGFGASAAWWAKKVGTWSDEDAQKPLELLYSKEKGIGLNIYRYNLGAGSAKTDWNDENPSNVNPATGEGDARMDVGKSAESFVKSYDSSTGEFTYDWNQDKGAQNCLRIANKLCSNLRVTLFCNSPPVELTKNGRATGYYVPESYTNDLGQIINYGVASQNIAPANYAAFAKYVNTCAKHFVDEGYRVTDVSPVNEPQFAWSTDEKVTEGANELPGWSSQEGCHYFAIGDWIQGNRITSSLETLYEQMLNVENGYNAKTSSYKISAWEAAAAEAEYENNAATPFKRFTESIFTYGKTRNSFDSISVHSYWSDKERKQACRDYIDNNPNQYINGISIACTEYCQMTNDPTTGVFDQSSIIEWWDPERNGLGIEYGVQMARTMYEDLTVLNCTEWDWWTACSNGYYPDGLVYLSQDYNDHKNILTSKRLWCLGNYSKFIEEGAKRVEITESNSNLLSSAYKNPDGSLVVVYVNQNTTPFNVKLGNTGYTDCGVYVTDATRNLENTASTFATNQVVQIPSQSVVTVVLK